MASAKCRLLVLWTRANSRNDGDKELIAAGRSRNGGEEVEQHTQAKGVSGTGFSKTSDEHLYLRVV